MVFDSRSETDPFSGVKYWVRALAQARRLEGSTAVPMQAYLVAARADRGGVGVSAERIRAMVDDLGLDGFFETSAKEGWQITELTRGDTGGHRLGSTPDDQLERPLRFDQAFLLEENSMAGRCARLTICSTASGGHILTIC